jgi:hypothetical protein
MEWSINMEKEFEAFEEDFEVPEEKYQLWLLGYDADQNITDFEFLVNESSSLEVMLKQAKQYIDEEKYKNRTFPDNVTYLEVIVETIANIEGYDENIATRFDEIVKIK